LGLDGIRAGDVVECEINGRAFRADVAAIEDGRLVVAPICRNISYRHASAKQVKRHWRLSRYKPQRVHKQVDEPHP
jgi:hypothetical protein